MREDHRPQEADPAREPYGGLERERLEDADGEEDRAEQLRRRVEPARQPVREERVDDEAPAEAVEREEGRETQDDPARAVKRRPFLQLPASLHRA